jgi:hypothetical protein
MKLLRFHQKTVKMLKKEKKAMNMNVLLFLMRRQTIMLMMLRTVPAIASIKA